MLNGTFIFVVLAGLALFCVVGGILFRRRNCGARRVFLRYSEEDSWNVLRVLDEWGVEVNNLVAVRAEFWTRAREKEFEQLLEANPALKVLLLSSYQEFPAPITNPFEAERTRRPDTRFVERFGSRVLLWCHCFRDPDTIWRTSVPKLLLSESDLLPRPSRQVEPRLAVQYDFVASVGSGAWNEHIRHLDIVVELFRVAAQHLHAHCALVGDATRAHFFHGTSGVDVLPFLPHADFLALLRRSRFLVCAAAADASPRILVEAGREGCALLVHEHLLGGWKYVVPGVTGRFFNGSEHAPTLLADFAEHFRDARASIRTYFDRTTDPDAHTERLVGALRAVHSFE